MKAGGGDSYDLGLVFLFPDRNQFGCDQWDELSAQSIVSKWLAGTTDIHIAQMFPFDRSLLCCPTNMIIPHLLSVTITV